jgi:hypothetical protein
MPDATVGFHSCVENIIFICPFASPFLPLGYDLSSRILSFVYMVSFSQWSVVSQYLVNPNEGSAKESMPPWAVSLLRGAGRPNSPHLFVILSLPHASLQWGHAVTVMPPWMLLSGSSQVSHIYHLVDHINIGTLAIT